LGPGAVSVDNSRRSCLTPYTAPNDPLSLEASTHGDCGYKHHTFAHAPAVL